MKSNEETPYAPRRPYDDYVEAKQEVSDIAMVLAARIRSGEVQLDGYLAEHLVAAADRVLQLREWILRENVS